MPNGPRRPRASATEDTAVTEPAGVTETTGIAAKPVTYAWLIALLIAAVGAFVGMLFLHYRKPPQIGSPAGFRLSTVFLLVAAIERVVEGVNHFLPLGGDTNADPGLHGHRVAICLGLASALAMVACGYFGIGILHAFGDNGSPRYVDVVVTGLGVGAATKPLHDLIRGIERWSHPQAEVRP